MPACMLDSVHIKFGRFVRAVLFTNNHMKFERFVRAGMLKHCSYQVGAFRTCRYTVNK